MPIDFPTNPANGQTLTDGDKTWEYVSSISAWRLRPRTVAGPQGPTGPEAGALTLTSRGDLLGRTTTSLARVPVGANNTILTADSSQTTGLRWANPIVAGSNGLPLSTDGARLSGSGLVLSGLASNYASSPDSAALSVTGDIDIKVKVAMDDWTPSTDNYLVAKWVNAGQRSFYLAVTTTGLLQFGWSADGTANTSNLASTVATGFADGSTNWVRVTFQANNGASGRNVKYYTSSDGTTWTQLGSTRTGVNSSIFDGTDPLNVGALQNAVNTSSVFAGTIYRTIIQSAYDTANNTASLVYDANFETATADALAFTGQSGTGIKADGLVLAGRAGEFASAPDSAALSITGDIDIKTKVTLTDWTPAAIQYWVSKQDTTALRSYYFGINTNGTLRLVTSPDNTTQIAADSTVATGVSDGATKWVRATRDVNNGASGNDTKFYLSDDGITWTQLGTTVTNAGTTSISDNASILTIGARGSTGASDMTTGTVHEVIIQSAYDTANNTASLVFDADFDAQAPETQSFTESSANAARVGIVGCYPVVTINTTRYSLGIPNMQFSTISSGATGADLNSYCEFLVTAPISVDMAAFEVITAPTTTSIMKIAIYASDSNFQPTGAPLANFGSITVVPSATGVYSRQIAPVILQPGGYIMAFNSSLSFAVRTFKGGATFVRQAMGTSPFMEDLYVTGQSNASFPQTNPPVGNIFGSNVNSARRNYILLRWTAA